jgi:mannose-6-phosphate isomerase-like protein (cupin superfamily)
MLELISDEDSLLAIILRRDFKEPGVHFFTPGELSQQLGYMNYPAGKTIEAHIHNPVSRHVRFTNEVLFIKSGKLRVDFYNDEQKYLKSRVLEAGDTILLVAGGHGFEVLEAIEMLEVKQGPYCGDADKTRFAGISAKQARYEKEP